MLLPTPAAKVYLNGERMRGAGDARIFTTPVLPLDKEFQYYVTARYPEQGHVVTTYRKLDVGAGEYTVADFTHPQLSNPTDLPPGLVDENQVKY